MEIPTGNFAYESPAAWAGADLQPRSDWVHELTAVERAALERAACALRDRAVPIREIDVTSHPLPELYPAIRRWRDDLRQGRGFVLVRGMAVADHSADDLARVYWLLGRHLGDPVPQNPAGELLCDVRDTGADARDPNTRLYTTRAEQDFHTDGADIIGLLCLRPAKSGGVSRIVSSLRVYREIVARRPELAPLLFEDWHWHLHGQAVPFPICRFDGRALSTFFIGWYIRKAQTLPDVPPLTAEQRELLELYEAIANDPALYLDMDFRPGDIQLLKNSVILHKRTEYEDWSEPERKRHLLRLWLAARDFEDGDERLRAGVAPATDG